MTTIQTYKTDAGRIIYGFQVQSFAQLVNNIYVISINHRYDADFLQGDAHCTAFHCHC